MTKTKIELTQEELNLVAWGLLALATRQEGQAKLYRLAGEAGRARHAQATQHAAFGLHVRVEAHIE